MSIQSLVNKNLLVLGLGKTGLAAVDTLINSGALVHCYDDKVKSINKNVIMHTSISDINISKIDGIVVSPGIAFSWPVEHELVKIARRSGVPIFSDLDIFLKLLGDNQKVIAVTGTNGKSTTTSLIYHVLKAHGDDVEIGGNIGNPLLNLRTDADTYVLELSSYQLELTSNMRFSTAVLLNITPDHLSRHGGIHGYISAKEKIFLDNDTKCIVGIDDCYSREIRNFLKQYRECVIPISGENVPQNGIGWQSDRMYSSINGESRYILDHVDHLDGAHNRQNIAAAYAAVEVASQVFSSALHSFKGLEHRQEILRYGDIIFVNDSKATNADATEPAIRRFLDKDILWIAGGLPKEGGIKSLKSYFSCIKKAYLIGDAADDFAQDLEESNVHCCKVGTLENAVLSAYSDCSRYKNPVILFSPACASFDQFANFEERGAAFKCIVNKIIGEKNDRVF